MKLRSALNNGFLFLSLGTVFVGLVKVEHFDIFKFAPFLLFFVFFRIKMWLDDSVYFHRTKRKGIIFDLGVLMAIIAWSLWAIAGYSIGDTQLSYKLIMWAIMILSIWIILDAIDQRSFGDGRSLFFIINLIYIAVLWFLTCDECSVPFDKSFLAYVLIAGTVIDFLFNSSLKHFVEQDAPCNS